MDGASAGAAFAAGKAVVPLRVNFESLTCRTNDPRPDLLRAKEAGVAGMFAVGFRKPARLPGSSRRMRDLCP